ncbi:MAG: amino acid adenylation domain-containing protein, partial [Actinomycetota bacterium]|nr:amino acid adenylation domain-containing protein [Actinomycetota bacterium]
ALDQLIERHEILRTSIVHEPGGLMQVVHERVEPDLTFEGASSTSPSVQKLAERASAFAERPFDVITAPLWRVLLIRLRADQHVVVLAMHRAVGDASTVARVLEELLALIDPPTGGTDGRFQPAPRQYGEYARRQRSIDEAVLDGQKAYWLEYLEGEVEPAALPMYGTRPPVRSAHDGWHRLVLPPELAANADRFAARSGCPLAAVVTAVFAALLYRYGARSEVAFGHTLRVRSGHGDAVLGPCGNLAVMRLVVAEETTFDEVLAVAAARLARANGNGDFPFQQLVRALDIQWDPNTAPLFQLLLDSELDIAPACSLSRPGGLQVEELPTAPGASGYDVRLVVRRAAEGPALDWCYDADLFAPELIARVAEHFVQLLSAGLADPGTPIAQLALLSRAEREAIEQRWNTTRTPYHRCAIHRLIEEQVARTPDVVAVEFGDLKLTYAQLNSRANRLARHLLSLGAAEGDMVALCMDRSADLVVAVVAILKAQCVIVPLDPAYPQDRLAFMLDDADVRMVVTARELLERAPHLQGRFDSLIKVEIHAANPTIATQGEHDLEGDLRADAPAYCIYTSGSTGRPKGVVVEHGALANLVSWHLDSWLAAVGTRTLLYSPISFDVSFHEIAAGLCSGATLVQVDEVIRSNPMALLEFVREQRIEKWYMPFVTLQQVAQAARTSSAPGHLKELIVGGEVLRITPEIRDFARRSGCVIHNHYGSTECIDVATHTLSGDPDRWPSVAPIGRTNVHNMNLYILDPAQQLAPMGVAGEIYGEGDCLARGYHRRPELTEERFLPSPFGIQGSRLYRMGDLGRYLPDGTIECIGRADQQVKIRGFRVE